MIKMEALMILSSILVFSLSHAYCYDIDYLDDWLHFKSAHNKSYVSDDEEYSRKLIFKKNKQIIDDHNQKYSDGLVSFLLKVNEFADMSDEEFLSMTGYKSSGLSTRRSMGAKKFISPVNVKPNDQVDWREQGAVTPVKNQGACGSCWAFSVTGSLEGQNFRKNGQLVSLSEQNLVDCTEAYANNGCSGGTLPTSFLYIMLNNGIDTEDSYPYIAQQQECRFDPNNVGAQVSDFVAISEGNEEELKEAVATTGPVSVAIDAANPSFRFYGDGIYVEPSCSSFSLDHAVVVVGYGTEGGQDYWIVKNSWGTSWGNGGYIKMARNLYNQCGIASDAVYPVVK